MDNDIDYLDIINLFFNINNPEFNKNKIDFNINTLFFFQLLSFLLKKTKDEDYKNSFNVFNYFSAENLIKNCYPKKYSDYISLVSNSIYTYFDEISKIAPKDKKLIISVPDFTTSNIRNIIENSCEFYNLNLIQIYNNYICLALSIIIENEKDTDKKPEENEKSDDDSESDNDEEDKNIIMIYFGKFYLDISYFTLFYSNTQIRLECYYKRRIDYIGVVDIYLIIFAIFLEEHKINLDENEIKDIFILINESFDNYVKNKIFNFTFKKDNKEYNFKLEEKDFNDKILDPYLNYLKPKINYLIELILIENELDIDKINWILNVGEMFEISHVKTIFEGDFIKGKMSNFFEKSLKDKTYKEHIKNALEYLEVEKCDNASIEISDVCAQNISFKLIGNKCSTIIDKNNNYDKTVSKEMYLLDLKKDYFNLILYEGNYLRIDRNYFINNYKISEFSIENKNDNDDIVIKVNFNLNKNGVLNIEAFEMGNNNKNENDNKKLFIDNEINVDLDNNEKLSITFDKKINK